MNSGFSEPSALNRTSWKRKPAYSGTSLSLRRKRAGMIRSVSTFGRSIGSATAVRRVKACISGVERADVGEPARDGGGRRHRRRHEMRPGALALAPLEVAVRGRRHALALAGGLAVHPDAHRTARLPPLEAGVEEDPLEPLGLGGALDQPRARDHPRRHDRAPPLRDARRRAEVVEATVGAG